jgi:large conductance mechanosensitive channel
MEIVKRVSDVVPARQAYSFFEEFRNFAFKGNLIDLAVGVIIGTAFGGLINSLVKNLLMPVINLVVPGDQSYTKWEFVMNEKTVPYGLFLGDVVNFIIVAFAVWLFLVKFIGWVAREKKAEAAAPPPPTRDQELLMEIRDLLKTQSGPAAQPQP